jgi:hypothetical protein
MPIDHEAPATDVHQHLWPDELVDRLRARHKAPYLRGWTLHTDGEPPYDVDPTGHDVEARIAADRDTGVGLACLSLSAPLGIESLPGPEARPLLDAWHRGVQSLPDHFRAWASVTGGTGADVDVAALGALLATDRFVGVQLPATDLLTPVAWERAARVLLAAELAGKPVFVHPGPEPGRGLSGQLPAWWAPVVGYVAQMQAAWWGWQAFGGRALFPRLRLLFGAAAGLAPVHTERYELRGGGRVVVDTNVFLEALVRVLGIDVLALGSDRPYGVPLTEFLGAAATRAVRVVNPARLLEPAASVGGEQEWAVAS